MKSILAVMFLFSACACPKEAERANRVRTSREGADRVRVEFSDVDLREDQIVVCGYSAKHQAMVCMTPEEARARVEAARSRTDL